MVFANYVLLLIGNNQICSIFEMILFGSMGVESRKWHKTHI